MKKIFFTLTLLLLITCSKDSADDNSSVYVAPPTNTTNPTTTPTVTQYTLTVTAGSGGSVSTAGGTYNDGTSISITATPSEGYGFIGWNGSDSTSSTISVTLTANTTIEALFGQLPQLTLPDTPSKMFTKGVGDTLSIGFSHAGGYKTTSLSAEYGSVSVISEPNEGDTEGNIVIEYTVNTVENVDRMTTIAGFDEIEISISGSDDLTNASTYQVRSQPEPIYKDYFKPSHDLVKTRANVDPPLIRYLNQKDNDLQISCQVNNVGYNQSGNDYDAYGGIAFADVNGDGYDDMLIHPQYSEGSATNYTTVKREFELYVYEDGEYNYHEMNFDNVENLEAYLSRKILVGDYDNDGDPDFYSANYGIDDGLGVNTEKSFFIINNFNISESFSIKENPHMEGVHEASSADIDNDGYLDIYSKGRLGISQPSSPFYKNMGNFELKMWSGYTNSDNIIINPDTQNWAWQYDYFSKYITSELIDINSDGYVDLILGAHEWEKEAMVIWGGETGFNTNDKTIIPEVANPASFPMGVILDFKVSDLDYDGFNEIIILRSGGDSDNGGTDIGNFYAGWYLQILKANGKELIDITSSIIEDNYYDSQTDPVSQCQNVEDNWIFWIVIDDYDKNGALDIFNRMLGDRPLHRWEWNGSKFSKID